MTTGTSHGTAITVAFGDETDARTAIRELKEAGFTDAHIGFASFRNQEFQDPRHGRTTTTEFNDGSRKTAAAGAVAGLGVGTAWGVGILTGLLPGIGPAIVGGTLGVLLSNATVGAAAAGLAGAFVGLGMTDEEATEAERDLRSGKIIVTVNAGDRAAVASAIIQRIKTSGHRVQ